MVAVPDWAALLSAASSSTNVLNCSRPAASALRRAVVATCVVSTASTLFNARPASVLHDRTPLANECRRAAAEERSALHHDWAQCVRDREEMGYEESNTHWSES